MPIEGTPATRDFGRSFYLTSLRYVVPLHTFRIDSYTPAIKRNILKPGLGKW
jgi:hypothetical protein